MRCDGAMVGRPGNAQLLDLVDCSILVSIDPTDPAGTETP